MDELVLRYRTLFDRTNTHFVRYLQNHINWESRMISVVGARGVGKTTMLLQHIKMNLPVDKTLFVNADDFYFSDNTLFQLAEEFSRLGGMHLFIDEIHKYKAWSKELKMMYDYLPDLQVVFTGSSILEIYKGQADLSRRVLSYHLHGMSFREFINLKLGTNYQVLTFDEVLKNKVKIKEKPLPLFLEYLDSGYYPFYVEGNYYERLNNVINLTLEIDIPTFTDMTISTARKLKQLLYIVAQSVPFKPNLTKIGEQIGVHRNQVAEYLVYLERAALINRLLEPVSNLGSLRKVQKVYLNNTNISKAIAHQNTNIGTVRETFFLNQCRAFFDVTPSRKSDFEINKYTFEIGGKNKKQTQIKDVPNSFIVKDNIEYGISNILPLWTFGFMY